MKILNYFVNIIVSSYKNMEDIEHVMIIHFVLIPL